MSEPRWWRNFINFVRVFPIRRYEEIEGWLSREEALRLYRLARSLPPGSDVVEIGSWKGKSTYCLARGLRGGRVMAIDPFNTFGEPGSKDSYQEKGADEDLHQSMLSSMKRLGVLERLRVMKGMSADFVDSVSEVGLLFIDGDHSVEGCRFDFEQFGPKVIAGGYIAFHDYDPARLDLGPTWVINNLIGGGEEWERVGVWDRLWVGRRRGD